MLNYHLLIVPKFPHYCLPVAPKCQYHHSPIVRESHYSRLTPCRLPFVPMNRCHYHHSPIVLMYQLDQLLIRHLAVVSPIYRCHLHHLAIVPMCHSVLVPAIRLLIVPGNPYHHSPVVPGFQSEQLLTHHLLIVPMCHFDLLQCHSLIVPMYHSLQALIPRLLIVPRYRCRHHRCSPIVPKCLILIYYHSQFVQVNRLK